MSERPLSPMLPVTPEEGAWCQAAARLARQLSAWHETGRWHGQVGVRTVAVDGPGGSHLAEPESVVRLGEVASDWERLPAVLHERLPLELSSDLALARRRLRAIGITLDPVQIDLYALAALLCRWITGESASAFLRSPKVKRLVPDALQPVLERALGPQADDHFVNAARFGQALEGIIGQPQPLPNDEIATPITEPLRPGSSADRPTSDTTPSAISPLPGNDTSVILPATEGSSSASRPPDSAGISSQNQDAASGHSARTGPDDALPFATLGHYEIRRRIGHGGMGDVYLGYERALDREVAIKVLPAELARDAEFVRRFRAEATAVARLIHPNIVPIYFIGEDQGHHYYAMQFIAGESLAELLARRGKLSLEEALPIVEQTLAGLALAHEHGMVHRDIKPGNILLDRNSRRALLADFGLVKSLGSSITGKTATGVVMGTVDYISPEQGRGLAVDARSDLYSIGVLLFRMLSGKLPFSADSPTALIFLHVYELPPKLSQLVADIAPKIECVIERLLAKRVEERYRDARALLADLQAIRTGTPLPSASASGDARAPASEATNDSRIILAPKVDDDFVVDEATASLRNPGLWERVRGRAMSVFWRQAPEVVRQWQGTQQQIDGAIARKRREEESLRRLAEEAESVFAFLVAQAREHREAAEAKRSESSENRDTTVIHVAQGNELRAMQESENLQVLASEQQEQLDDIKLKLAQCVARRQELENRRDVLQARLRMAGIRSTPNRKRAGPAARKRKVLGFVLLAVTLGGAVYLNQNAIRERREATTHSTLGLSGSAEREAPVNSGHTTTTIEDTDLALKAPLELLGVPLQRSNRNWPTPQSEGIHGLTFRRGDDQVTVISLGSAGTYHPESWIQSGSVNFQTTEPFESGAISPDGESVAAVMNAKAERPGEIRFYAMRTGQLRRSTPATGVAILSPNFSPDGKLVAAIHLDEWNQGQVHLWNVESATEAFPIARQPADVKSIAFHPRSSRLAVGGGDGKLAIHGPSKDSTAIALSGHTSGISALAFTPDGKALVSGDIAGNLILWDVTTGQRIGRFAAHRRAIQAIAFSTNGRSMATSDSSGTLLWETSSGIVRKVLRTRGKVLLAFHPQLPLLVTAELDSRALTTWKADTSGEPRTESLSGVGYAPADRSLPFTPILPLDSKRYLIGSGATVWLVDQGLRTKIPRFRGNLGTIRTIALSGDRNVLAAGDEQGTIEFWNSTSGESLGTLVLSAGREAGSDVSVRSLSLAPDGRQALIGLVDGAYLTRPESREAADLIPLPLREISALAWSRRGERVLVAGHTTESGRTTVSLWNIESQAVESRVELSGPIVTNLAFAQGDTSFVCASGEELHWVDARPGKIRQTWPIAQTGPGSLSISPNGRYLIVTEPTELVVRDLEIGNELCHVGNSASIPPQTSVAFSPDGQTVFCRDATGVIRSSELFPPSHLKGFDRLNLAPLLKDLQGEWNVTALSSSGLYTDWQGVSLDRDPGLRLMGPAEDNKVALFQTDGGWWVNDGALIPQPGSSRVALDFGERRDINWSGFVELGKSSRMFFLLAWDGRSGSCLEQASPGNEREWVLSTLPDGKRQKISLRRGAVVNGRSQIVLSTHERGMSLQVNGVHAGPYPYQIPLEHSVKGQYLMGVLNSTPLAPPLRFLSVDSK